MGKNIGLVRRAGKERRMDSNNIHLRLPHPPLPTQKYNLIAWFNSHGPFFFWGGVWFNATTYIDY